MQFFAYESNAQLVGRLRTRTVVEQAELTL